MEINALFKTFWSKFKERQALGKSGELITPG